jgi:hypothetical protein
MEPADALDFGGRPGPRFDFLAAAGHPRLHVVDQPGRTPDLLGDLAWSMTLAWRAQIYLASHARSLTLDAPRRIEVDQNQC